MVDFVAVVLEADYMEVEVGEVIAKPHALSPISYSAKYLVVSGIRMSLNNGGEK